MDKSGLQLPSSYVEYEEVVKGAGAGAYTTYQITLKPAELEASQRTGPHAIYLQAWDMSSEQATNWICFMAGEAANADEFCAAYCTIARARSNAVNETSILTDDGGCVSTEYTGDKF